MFTHVHMPRDAHSPLWTNAHLGNSVFTNQAPAALEPKAQWCEPK